MSLYTRDHRNTRGVLIYAGAFIFFIFVFYFRHDELILKDLFISEMFKKKFGFTSDMNVFLNVMFYAFILLPFFILGRKIHSKELLLMEKQSAVMSFAFAFYVFTVIAFSDIFINISNAFTLGSEFADVNALTVPAEIYLFICYGIYTLIKKKLTGSDYLLDE